MCSLTERCEKPRAERAAALAGRRQTSGGSSHQHSSLSKDNGDRSGGCSVCTSDSALLSSVAEQEKEINVRALAHQVRVPVCKAQL